MTRLNIKTFLLLALAMMCMVSAKKTSLRQLRKLEADADKDEPKDIMITKSKGKDGAADEIDLDIKLKTCKEGSEECKTIEDDADDVEDVSLAMFSSLMAEEMVSALEKDEDGDDENRMLGEAERNLGCYILRRCWRVRLCNSGGCYYRYYCRYYRYCT